MTVVNRQLVSARKQIGTLGGGNHFIELQRCNDGYLWIMLHSGSRNLGKMVGDYYNQMAETLNTRWYSSVKPDIKLAFLPLRAPEFKQYWAKWNIALLLLLPTVNL